MNSETFCIGSVLDSRDILERDDAAKVKESVFEYLSGLKPKTVVSLDFNYVRFIDATCADLILVGILRRLLIGEYPEVFAVLSNLKEQHRGNISLALSSAKKSMIILEDAESFNDIMLGWSFTGNLLPAYAAVLNRVIIMKGTTAKELQDFMKYPTVNEASTKLSGLYAQRLITREQATGRAFRYMGLI